MQKDLSIQRSKINAILNVALRMARIRSLGPRLNYLYHGSLLDSRLTLHVADWYV